VFREYVDKAGVQAEVTDAFFSGIERLAGVDCRRRCETGGLSTLHLAFPAESVHLLEAFVSQRIKRRMLEWSAAMGKQDLGYQGDFLVEDLLVVRGALSALAHRRHERTGAAAASPISGFATERRRRWSARATRSIPRARSSWPSVCGSTSRQRRKARRAATSLSLPCAASGQLARPADEFS
jgi:hypothetical protein